VIARSPTTQRIAGSWHSRSASFASLIAGEPSEYRLPQQADQSVAAVLARARIGKRVAAGVRQAQRVIQLAIRQQNRASEVITLPRNWSIRCRSKSSCDELNQHRSLTL
jgi:hypothetical protein